MLNYVAIVTGRNNLNTQSVQAQKGSLVTMEMPYGSAKQFAFITRNVMYAPLCVPVMLGEQ